MVGFKYVRLYPASNTPYLYRSAKPWAAQRRWPTAETEADAAPPAGQDPQGTISLVDVEAPDLQRFPLFEKARYMETVLVRAPPRLRRGACALRPHTGRPGAGPRRRAVHPRWMLALREELVHLRLHQLRVLRARACATAEWLLRAVAGPGGITRRA